MAMVATLPSQLPIHPQASFPAAPPIKTSVKANPAVVTAAPFPISRNGRHTKKAASHDAVRDAEQDENAKAEAARRIAFAVLAQGKLGGGRLRLRRDPRCQNGY